VPLPLTSDASNHAKIESALVALLNRHNEDAFVIFEEKATGKFVQFAGSSQEDLLLDLPSQTLDRAEMARAITYFLEVGIEADVYDVFDRPGATVVGQQCSFQHSFGRDARTAAEIASAVFLRVYRFPVDFDLVITEN
jgi:hypothetical protein